MKRINYTKEEREFFVDCATNGIPSTTPSMFIYSMYELYKKRFPSSTRSLQSVKFAFYKETKDIRTKSSLSPAKRIHVSEEEVKFFTEFVKIINCIDGQYITTAAYVIESYKKAFPNSIRSAGGIIGVLRNVWYNFKKENLSIKDSRKYTHAINLNKYKDDNQAALSLQKNEDSVAIKDDIRETLVPYKSNAELMSIPELLYLLNKKFVELRNEYKSALGEVASLTRQINTFYELKKILKDFDTNKPVN